MSKLINSIKDITVGSDWGLILLNKELYYKVLFIESGDTDSMLNIVDNGDDFISLIFKTKDIGHYFNARPFFFRNNLTDEIFFSLHILPFYDKCGVLVNNLNKLFFCLEKNKRKKSKKNMGLIFLKAHRGGFRCIYIGALGFLPQKQLSYLIPLFFSSHRKKKYKKLNLILFSKDYYSIFFIRIYWCFVVKIRTLNFYNRKQIFVKTKIKKKKYKKRKNKYLSSIVFLCKNYNKKLQKIKTK